MEVILVGVFVPFSMGMAGPSPVWSDSRVLSLESLLTCPLFGGGNFSVWAFSGRFSRLWGWNRLRTIS